MSYTSNATGAPVWGIDQAIVAAAIERARRERSLAFWAMLRAITGRSAATPEVPEPDALAAR